MIQLVFPYPIQFLCLYLPLLHECNLLSQLLQSIWQRRFFGDLESSERIQLDLLTF